MELKLNLKGTYKLNITEGDKKTTLIIPNLITTIGKGMVASILTDSVDAGMFQYFSFGDSNTTPAIGNTKLSSEVGRLEVLTKSAFGSQITLTGFVPSDELVGFTLQEIGLFGINAGATLDSGLIFSRALISPTITKTSVMEISISYVLTIS